MPDGGASARRRVTRPWRRVAWVTRRWPAQRVALPAVAEAAPEPKSVAEVRISGLSGTLTYGSSDSFTVTASNLTTVVGYDVIVSRNNSSLGIGACGTSSQTQRVSGVTSQDLSFTVHACGAGSGTVTAVVRRTGLTTNEDAASQAVTVRARAPQAPARPTAPNPKAREFTARWEAPGDTGGTALTGYHVLMRPNGAAWPPDRDATKVGATTRSQRFSGLSPNRIYWFKVKACNGANQTRCSGWSPKASVTLPIDRPKEPRWGSFTAEATQIRVTWSAPDDTGGVGLTGYGLRHWRKGASEPSSAQVVVNAQTSERTFGGLAPNTGYWFSIQACNGTNRCSGWTNKDGTTPRTPTPTPTTPPAEATKPGQVGRPDVSPRDAALHVDWDAPGDGGSAISHYDLRYRAGTSGSWTQTRVPPTATETVPTDMTVSSLSNGTAYQVQVRACNTHGCGDWSPTATGTPSAMAPGELPGAPPGEVTVFVPCGVTTTGVLAKPQLTIAPVPQRRAALMWNGTTGADRYVVEVRRYGAQAWSSPVHGETVTAEGRNPCYTLKLDAIMTLAGGTTQGLAENDAYQLRVTARDTSNAGIVSDVVTLVDTPITRANGDSRDAGAENGPGLAEITWRPLHQQVAGLPSNGEYQLRHRVAFGSHASPEWDPSKFGAFADPVTEASSPQEIGKLQLHEMYAIQLTYDSDNSGTPDVFAARDVYVWPSRSQATSGRRIAGFPVVRTLRDATFTYRICPETFLVEGKTRRTAWLRLIRDAAARWQAAVTTDLVTFNEQAEPCISYEDIADDWAQIVWNEVMRLRNLDPPITDLNTLASHIETFVTRTREEQMRLWTPFRVRIATRNIQDKAYNEILLFDDVSASLKTLIKYRVFDELASDLGSSMSCWYELGDMPDQPIGCAHAQGFKGPFGDTHFTTDIFFRRSAFVDDPLDVPGPDAKMNFCGFGANAGGAEGVGSAYATAGHEIGHALGITQYAGADNSQWSLPGHPPYEVVDSIMSYNDQPRCAPYPLDLMAIHALYQTVD